MAHRIFVLFALLVSAIALGACGGTSHKVYAPSNPAAVQTADKQAQAQLRSAATAMEAYATDQGGGYAGATVDSLRAFEPKLPQSLNLTATADGYEIALTSTAGGNVFKVAKQTNSGLQLTCTQPGRGDCPASGTWH